MKRAFMFRSITNAGLPAKFIVYLEKEEKWGAVTICKTYFSPDDKTPGVIKRKWKNYYFCEEIMVLKLETVLTIANEVAIFCKEMSDAPDTY